MSLSSGSLKLELNLLYKLSETVFHQSDIEFHPLSITNLTTLLLGLLRAYVTSKKIKIEESWVTDILSIYKSLVHYADDVSQHISFLSKLFGPATHVQSLFNLASIRVLLLEVCVCSYT